jgi:hypothetical protein
MPSPEEQARRRRHQIAAQIAKLGPCLPGTLVERMTRCGSATCHCHGTGGQLHGPYPSWVRKVGTRTITRSLSPAQVERYRPLFDNAKRLRELVAELEALSARTVDQAEGWPAPEHSAGVYVSDSGDTAIDNASTPREKHPVDYGGDTSRRA